MSAEEQIASSVAVTATALEEETSKAEVKKLAPDTKAADATATTTDAAKLELERSEKILKAKELYSHGSRNFLVKSYAEAADELSQVCSLYEELYGELSDELGMPYLLYAKSLIALALDENKVIDVPDAEDDDDDDDEEEDEEASGTNGMAADDAEAEANGAASSSSAKKVAANGIEKKLTAIQEDCDEADSTGDAEKPQDSKTSSSEKATEGETEVTSSDATDEPTVASGSTKETKNGSTESETAVKAGTTKAAVVADDEKPSTSNGDAGNGAEEGIDDEEEENEAASSLQLAWEILELAAKIFTRQGLSGLANLAEVQTELANIEFENSILDAARDDYEKALKIYADLPTNYRRAMAEIHYKIGLTFLMQQMNKEGAASLKSACNLIESEIESIKEKEENVSEKDKNTIQDLEETKQEIWAKITEIEEMQAQTIAEVRAALDSYIKPMGGGDHAVDGAGPSSSSSVANGSSAAAAGGAASSSSSGSSSAISSSSKPKDISHLIKRKKPEEPNSEAEAVCSPAKRAAV